MNLFEILPICGVEGELQIHFIVELLNLFLNLYNTSGSGSSWSGSLSRTVLRQTPLTFASASNTIQNAYPFDTYSLCQFLTFRVQMHFLKLEPTIRPSHRLADQNCCTQYFKLKSVSKRGVTWLFTPKL